MIRRARPVLALVAVIAATLVLFGLGSWFVNLPVGWDEPLHLDLQLLGWSPVTDGVDQSDVEASMWLDMAFAIAYGFGLFAALKLIPRPDHLDERITATGRALTAVPLVAMVADIAENALIVGTVTTGTVETGGETIDAFVIGSQTAEVAITALAWVKFLAIVVAVLLAGWWTIIAACPRPNKQPDGPDDSGDGPPVGGLALCCSGGGIRSAGFSIGALRALEEHGVMDRVDLLTAVSGGNYAATGWSLHRIARDADRVDGEGDSGTTHDYAADRLIESLLNGNNPFRGAESAVGEGTARIEQFRARPADTSVGSRPADPSDESVRASKPTYGRHRFLTNGPGGLGRALLWGVAAVAANIVQIAAIVVLVGWPLGWLLTQRQLHPDFGELLLRDDTSLPLATRHWGPVVTLIGIAVVATLIAAAFPSDGIGGTIDRGLVALGKGAFAIAALVGLVVVVFPWTLVQVYRIGGIGDIESLFTIGGLSLVTLGGSIFQLAKNPLRSRATKLGGIALALLLIVLLGKIVHDSATGTSAFAAREWWFAAIAMLVCVAFIVDTQMWSLRELYRARLANSFVPAAYRPKPLRARRRDNPDETVGLTWDTMRQLDGPELVVCCAASRIGLASTGIAAESFTVSQRQVCHYRAQGTVTVPTSHYSTRLNSMALQPLRAPGGWMATSGAAFASSMGKMNLGTTNALLAALNADLGVWLPAPRLVHEHLAGFPPVRLGHLVSEVFGLYSEQDEYVFVSDGGHVENLGLLEALRRQPSIVLCIDASGDEPGSFSTLRAAIDMADTELDVRLRFDLTALDESPTPPTTSVYKIPYWRWADPPPARCAGTIIYAKLQTSTGQPREVRRMANTDPKFPNYSTANQLLDDQQFAFLLVAGHHAGTHVAQLLAETEVQSTSMSAYINGGEAPAT